MNAPVLTLDPEDVTMAMSDQTTEWELDPATGKLCMSPDEAALMFGSEEAETWAPSTPRRPPVFFDAPPMPSYRAPMPRATRMSSR